jgi:hypothetical protein
LAFEHQKAAAIQACLKQPRLAHACLTGQQHNPTSAVVGRGKRLIQRGLLTLTPD